MRAPAVLLAVPLLAGCWLGTALGAEAPESLPLLAAAAAVLACLAALAWCGEDAAAVSAALAVGAACAGTSLGITSASRALKPPLLAWFEAHRGGAAPVLVEGILRHDAARTEYGASLELEVLGIAPVGVGGVPGCCRGGLRLSIGGAEAASFVHDWRAGRRIRAPATLRLPTVYRNPGIPDARAPLALRGVALVGSVKSAALVEVVARGGGLDEAAGTARAWTRARLVMHVGRFSERSSAIAAAILINDRSGLDPEDERRLQEAGTYHVIAISGGNIAILTALLLGICRLCRAGPRTAAALAIAFLIFYAGLTGAPASVGRAVTAAVVYLSARILDHRGPPLNALAVAAIFALAAWPAVVADAGFLLSFGATLGLLLGTTRLVDALSPWSASAPARRTLAQRLGRAVWTVATGLFAATLCAEVALMPIAATIFGRVTVAGLIVNFAAVPLMTVTQIGAMATLIAPLLSEALGRAAAATTHAAAFGLVESARLVDVAPWLAREVPRPAVPLVVCYYGLVLWLVFARQFRAWAAAAVAVAYALIASAPLPVARDADPPRPGWLRVVFLDVGQGDATLVTLPDGRSLLVDAAGSPGTSFDVGRRVVVPALRPFGVSRLEELIVTHGDADHVGGALAVARAFRPRVVREGVPVPPNADLRALAAHARKSGMAWRRVQAGDADDLAGVGIRVWHPPLPDWERQRVRNDDSVVLELRYGDVSVVLPGDIGREPEQQLASRMALAPLVVLKAAHHGSASSSTPAFVRVLTPAAVVFSAGRNNPFGHPAPAVLRRYHALGAEILRTDEDGAVVVETDGREVKIRTVAGRRLRIHRP